MSVFVTLTAGTRYLKAITAFSATAQGGVTADEVAEAEVRAESWVRIRLRGAYDLSGWTTPALTPIAIREAADQYASALVLWWLFQKNPKKGGEDEIQTLFAKAEHSAREARDAPALYLTVGTEVKRRSDASAVSVIRGDRPLFPAERLQDWRQRHELPEERQSYLEEVDLYTK